MKIRIWLALLMAACLFLAGCQNEPATKVPDVEPVATYDWMAGESPIPNQRSGIFRACVNKADATVSPSGVYFAPELDDLEGRYILYADHGSDTFIKLCGRADCTHATPDCNAYIYAGQVISYYDGYLYAVSGVGGGVEQCDLIRMDPDGSNRVTLLDLDAFAAEHDGDYAKCHLITEGLCLFGVYYWKPKEDGSFSGVQKGYYYFKLDGSMEEPVSAKLNGLDCYNCGDVFLVYSDEAQNGGEYGSYLDWDSDTNTATYLTDHSGQPGWYGEKEAYYFKDGAICRLNYATQTEEKLVDTGLEGKYYLFSFPDCMVVASRTGGADDNLYIYNWAYELVDTVKGPKSNDAMQHLLLAETAERFIFSDTWDGAPLYYINKSELGTGNAKLHSFKLPDL